MITDEYKRQLRETRAGWEDWGSSASGNAGPILRYLNRNKRIQTVLDFGCGCGTFGELVRQCQKGGALRKDITIEGYDPSIPGIDVLPDKMYDLIVSFDVLEHVEPDQIDATIKWLKSHSHRQWHHIDCNDTQDRLPDGRDVHLIVEEPEWWLDKWEADDWLVMEIHVHKRRRRKKWPRTSVTISMEYSP